MFILGANPFLSSFFSSDLFGKCIFIALFALSILSWILLIQKVVVLREIGRDSKWFSSAFDKEKHHPLNISLDHNRSSSKEVPHFFLGLYEVLKKQTVEMLNKNRWHREKRKGMPIEGGEQVFLSPSDLSLLEGSLSTKVSENTLFLEKNLFVLSTTVSLAPFLGLLGTVWGILITFAELRGASSLSSHEAVLGGLSMALATTVFGLLVAIPALVGYNYLKSAIRSYGREMEHFSSEMLTAVEMQYRKVDVD